MIIRIRPYSDSEIAEMHKIDIEYLLKVWKMKPRRMPEEDDIIAKLDKRWEEIQAEEIILGVKND